MATPQVTALTAPCAEPRLPGTWKLRGGRAITLEPSEAGVLRVAHGRIWSTFEGPHAGGPHARGPNDSGDIVLETGEQIRVAPGQRLVIESWSGGCPAYFTWDPVPVQVVVRRLSAAEVLQPLSELRLALVFGGHAVARLASGLGRIAWQSVFGPRASLEEQVCTRHGAPG